MLSLAATFCHDCIFKNDSLNYVLFISEVARFSDAAKWCLMPHFTS